MGEDYLSCSQYLIVAYIFFSLVMGQFQMSSFHVNMSIGAVIVQTLFRHPYCYGNMNGASQSFLGNTFTQHVF